MNQAKPTKPSRGNAKRPRPNPVEKAEHLQPIVEEEPVRELSMRDRRYLRNQSGKYLQQPKVGTPTLGRETGYVTEVGLGNLETQTAYDNSDLSA